MFSTKEPIIELFERIDDTDHHERLLFYEQHSNTIYALDQIKQLFFTYHYVCSLHALGRHDALLTVIDEVIEYTFINNVNFEPINTYESLLYKKAKALFATLKYDEAKSLGEQLIGIRPQEEKYVKLLQRINLAQLNYNSTGIRLTALILIFGSIIVTMLLSLTNQPFLKKGMVSVIIIISPCLLSISILGIAQGRNFFLSRKMTRDTCKAKQEKKKSHNFTQA